MNTFKIGDTVERIAGSKTYICMGTIGVVTFVNSGGSIVLEGFGTGSYDASFFKLVPERDVKRKALSDAIDLVCKHDIGRVRGSHNEFYFGSMDDAHYKTKGEVLNQLFPDNKEAEDKIQAIINQLQDNLVTAQQQLTDLKGE